MNTTHGNQKVTDQEIIDAIRSVKEPVASATDVAERCSLSRTAANNRLNELLADDRVVRKSVGKGYVWWLSDRSES